MYKCLECGNIFEEGEQAIYKESHGFSDGLYEEFQYCPICGGDIEETVRCEDCEGEFLKDELICGYCMECLQDEVTYDSFLDFATTGVDSATEVDVLEDFVLREIYKVNGDNVILNCSSADFKDACREAYQKAVDSDMKRKWLLGKGELLDTIRQYITDSHIWYEFAEYLEVKERGEKK